MNVSRFRHDRNASPTVREASTVARVKITDPAPPGSGTNSPASRALQGQFRTLSRITFHSNRVIESKESGDSFTSFTWPANHPEAMAMDHAHTRLDMRNLHCLETQAFLTQTIHETWGGRPILHAYELTSEAVEHDLNGKDVHERAMQTFVNCKSEAESLQTRYTAFAADATQLLASRTGSNLDSAAGSSAGSGSGSGASVAATGSAPLLRITEAVWPTMRFKSAAERSAWVARTLRDPQAFIAQSYDALSLAFGRVSVGISQAKNAVRETGCDKSQQERDSIMQRMQATDAAFLATEEVFDRIDIPIDPAILKGHSVLAPYSAPPM